MNKKIFTLIAGLFISALFTSCGEMGYSLVLWNNAEAGVNEGQIVKVYVKSNISHTYIIGIPETKKKVEIPLWQISEPASRSKTKKLAARHSEYEHTYASVKLDGLPIRGEPVNTAKQVYRLRKGEVIRVLYKGKGQAVTNGKGNLQGEWLRVLTKEGTQGWCFSFNLNLFERVSDDISSSVKQEEAAVEEDETLKAMLEKNWYPEYYSDMIRTGRYNFDLFTADFGFSFGNQEEDIHSARIKKADINKMWDYEKLNKKEDYVYQLDELQVTVTVRGKNSIAVQYMDIDGKMKNENFVAVEGDIQEIIDAESARRQDELKSIVAAGPVFTSSNYGTIVFNNENSVTWSNYQLLVPSIVSSSALGSVSVTVENYLSNQLKKEFDGILTFYFIGMEKPVNFFYKMDGNGLRLEDATKAQIKDNFVTSRGSSPLVMYFSVK